MLPLRKCPVSGLAWPDSCDVSTKSGRQPSEPSCLWRIWGSQASKIRCSGILPICRNCYQNAALRRVRRTIPAGDTNTISSVYDDNGVSSPRHDTELTIAFSPSAMCAKHSMWRKHLTLPSGTKRVIAVNRIRHRDVTVCYTGSR